MRKNRYLMLFTVVVCLGMLSACSAKRPADEATPATSRTTTVKVVLVDADAGLEQVIKQQQEVFTYLQDSIKVEVAYKNDAEIYKDFSAGKAEILILAHPLSDIEKENFKIRDTIYTQEVRLAYDAVAIIGGKQFDDSKLDFATLKKYATPGNKEGINLVFEQNSSVVKFVLDTLGIKDKPSGNVYAVKSVDEVIDYVSKNEKAIGFIPFSYVGDGNDTRTKRNFEKIKVLSLRTKNKEGKDVRATASQSDIAEGYYPLMHTINAITRYGYESEAARLFVDFMFRERGARIFLKAGLIPTETPERIIDVNTDGLKPVNQ